MTARDTRNSPVTERLKRWLASVLATLDVLTDRRLMRDLRGGDRG